MEEKVCQKLDELGIEYDIVHHEAFFTVQDASQSQLHFEGIDCKNLFLVDPKTDRYFLVSLSVDKRLNTKKIEKEFQIKKVKFANEEMLFEKLGVKSGSCSLLNIIERPETDVIFVIDQQVLHEEKVSFHPNINTATVTFASCDIEKIMKNYHVHYEFIEL